MEMIIYFIFLLLPHMSNAILCRICTNCELESEEIFSMCDVNQSCYTLNRIHSKMTEMGCGTSCSLMERVRTIDDPCHLCHYDMCNSGKKIIVQRNQIKTTTIINNLKERAKPDSYVEKDIAPFPIDETNPFPIEMSFPHRIVSSLEISKMNGSLITQATDSLNSLPIPIDESPASNREKSEKEGFIHFDYPHDILDEEFEKEVESNLNSKVTYFYI
ncbi:hypothetical protein PRIPAC_81521 [Pristionchus pacificus]|uniref:Uncharacterized protein n=1 Tax=Pristionchus pacificus TaxID=54126 RepID=A0A2A6BYQ6_PRIPA|nr:hypothetical protein PRIPAC_81521 [Pristionchus pacificus]|eukprot:PDM71030.1 hypothetical protein PRIPAC_44426 [Pristionchus pacificus]